MFSIQKCLSLFFTAVIVWEEGRGGARTFSQVASDRLSCSPAKGGPQVSGRTLRHANSKRINNSKRLISSQTKYKDNQEYIFAPNCRMPQSYTNGVAINNTGLKKKNFKSYLKPE